MWLARASKLAFRLAALAVIAGAASACSSVPDWVDPTTWVSSGPDQPETTTTDASAPADQTGSEGKTVAEASDKYPVLADSPEKAPPSTSTDDQKQVANALVADRTQAQYSAEALRAGSEPAAAPPPPPGAEPVIPPPPSSQSSTSAGTSAPPAPSPPTQTASEPPAARSPMPGTLPSESEPAAPAPQQQVASTAAAVATAPTPPPRSAPATSPVPQTAAPVAQMNPSDAALGFQPSHAPPLASQASSLGQSRGQQVAGLVPSAIPPAMATNGPATAVVVFGQETTVLNAEARAQVTSAAEAFKTKGGQGYIRVIGHSSTSGKLSTERKMVIDLERSQARANAVARELIKEGVPASKVLVEAVGDTRSGPDGERRADIFVQS